jgi:mannose-6-phosphate isomerase-like protein (cupin superfamily)
LILREIYTIIFTYRSKATISMSSQNTMRMVRKSSDQPDETRSFDKGKIQITNVGETAIGRATFEPGWKWSTSVKPLVKTDSCQVNHTMYVVSGKMHVRMDDGTEQEFGPGDTGIVPPGHDAWVVGNERFVGIDFTGAKIYAKKQ